MALNESAARALRFFQSRGYTLPQAQGIVGNLHAESGFNTTIRGDRGTAVGIAQWRGERLAGLQRFAAGQGQDWRSLDTQLGFVDHELRTTERSALARLLNSQDVRGATAAMIGYERPKGWTPQNPTAGHNFSGRLALANQARGLVTSQPTQTSPSDMRQLAQAAGRSVQGLKSTLGQVDMAGQQSVQLSSASGAPAADGLSHASGPAPNQMSTVFGGVMGAPADPPAAALGGTPAMLDPNPIGGPLALMGGPAPMVPAAPSGTTAPQPMADLAARGVPGAQNGGVAMPQDPFANLGGIATPGAATADAATKAARDAAIRQALFAGPIAQTPDSARALLQGRQFLSV